MPWLLFGFGLALTVGFLTTLPCLIIYLLLNGYLAGRLRSVVDDSDDMLAMRPSDHAIWWTATERAIPYMWVLLGLYLAPFVPLALRDGGVTAGIVFGAAIVHAPLLRMALLRDMRRMDRGQLSGVDWLQPGERVPLLAVMLLLVVVFLWAIPVRAMLEMLLETPDPVGWVVSYFWIGDLIR